MASVYLSPANPRVPLGTESDIVSAVDSGLLAEGHFVDLKRELPAGRAANRNLAKDLAAFAIDGGTLVVGIEETEDGSIRPAPQRLEGLPERIDQIAAMTPDPPLAVTTTTIPTTADPSTGYLLVHVPASATAPHQVDGRYIGRGDTTNRFLTDAEVLRLHQHRLAEEIDGIALLDAEIDRDPFDDAQRQQAHLFLVAEPLTSRPDMLVHITDNYQWQELLDLRQAGLEIELMKLLSSVGSAEFSPGLEEMQTFDRRSTGAAMSTYAIDSGRTRRAQEGWDDRESAAEFEVFDNGGLRIFSSRFSDSNDGGSQVVFESMAVGFTRQLLAIAAAAADSGGYLGNWTVAFGATGLRGAGSYRRSQGLAARHGAAFGEDTYKRAFVATYAGLTSRPGSLTSQLVGPLLRAFGTRASFAAALTDPTGAPGPP